jgi:hypothetical protein
MTCRDALDRLPLYLYGELPPQEEEDLEAHLHACASCQGEYAAYRQISQALDRVRAEPEPFSASQCRRELMARIRSEHAAGRPGWREWLRRSLQPLAKPAGALAMLAAGFVAGYWTPEWARNGDGPAGEPVLAAIRSVRTDDAGGVSISLDETRRRTVRGDLRDRRIAQLLMAAVRDQADPGLRVESIDILRRQPESAEIRQALLWALEHDPNPGVRLKAIEGLKPMAGDAEVRKTLMRALQHDNNAGVRVLAIDLLVQHRDDQVAAVLQGLVGREDNQYVRMRCKNALEEMSASVGAF